MKIAVLGGGTGLSTLLRGLKKLPFEISAIVSVCDDGSSTGRLREEFNAPAVGDIRKVLISLAENEDSVRQLLDYRFNTYSDLNGHPLGNLLLIGASEIEGNISDGISLIGSILKLKGEVIPLTEDNVVLVGKMLDGSTVVGEHNITESGKGIRKGYYKKHPKVNLDVLKAIRHADAIVLSMGSLFTSIIPNLLCEEVRKEIDKSAAKIIYVCNIMTQPGETDNFKVSDHIKLLNSYLGKRKVDAVVVNTGKVDEKVIENYATAEQKDLVVYDKDNLKKYNVDAIENDYITLDGGSIRHNTLRVSLDMLSYLLDKR